MQGLPARARATLGRRLSAANTGRRQLRVLSEQPQLARSWLSTAREAWLFLAVSALVLLIVAPPVVAGAFDLMFPPAETRLFNKVISSQRDPRAQQATFAVLAVLWATAVAGTGVLLFAHLPVTLALRGARPQPEDVANDPDEAATHLRKRPHLPQPDAQTTAASPQVAAQWAQPTAASEHLVGGRYRLVQELGRGAMGVVHRGHDEVLGRDVAVKELSAALGADAEFIERFRREARVLARLQHPNVVQVFDLVESPGRLWMVLAFVPGGDLASLVTRREKLPLPDALRLGSEIASGLQAAHAAGVVHRDVKPANVLLSEDGRALLGDFGLARAEDLAQQTLAGSVLGTPYYMSPEQASGQTAGPASDLYSLGVTLFHLVTGRVPFEGSIPEVLTAHALTPPPELSTVNRDTPPELARLVARLLAKAPGDRPASAGEVVEALTVIHAQVVGGAPLGSSTKNALP